MKIRRYKKENDKVITYYEDFDDSLTDDFGYGGWRAHDINAPKGTKHIYLDEFKAWGYSEDLPEAYRSCIYSIGMEEKVKKILNAAPYKS